MGLIKREYTDNETLITAENLNAIQDSVIYLENLGPDAIISTASGEAIAVSDSSAKKLVGLSVYGKSTQDGTPTPDAPVDIVSVGEDGSIGVALMGKNLLTFATVGNSTTVNGVTVTFDGAGCVLNGTPTVDYTVFYSTQKKLPVGKYYVSGGTRNSAYVQVTITKNGVTTYHMNKSFTIDGSETSIYISLQTSTKADTGTLSNYRIYPMLVVGANVPVIYEPYRVGNVTLSTPNGLRAIPTTDKALSTYTDASGQMWCADEIDLARGVLVQRLYGHTFTEHDTDYLVYSESSAGNSFTLGIGFTRNLPPILPNNAIPCVMSDIATGISDNERGNKDFFSVYCADGNHVIFRDSLENTVVFDTFKANLPGKKIIYVLATPIETALTDEEIATYKALHTNKSNTTVLNDSDAYMSLQYIADTKMYIDSKVSVILAATVE